MIATVTSNKLSQMESYILSDTIVLKKEYLATPSALSVLGALCAAQLLEHNQVSLFVDPKDHSIRLEPPKFSLLLSQLPEEVALSILALLQKPDSEMLEFLSYLEEEQTEMETSDK